MRTIRRAALAAFGLALLAHIGAVARAAETMAAAPAATVAPAPLGDVAAEVNGEKLMRVDIERLIESYKKRDTSLATGTPQAQSTLQTLRDNLTDELIDRKLMSQEAKRLKITIADADVDKAMLEFKKGFKDEADMQGWLKNAGKSQADLRQLLSEQMAIDELQTRWIADVTVTPADIKKRYDETPADFMAPERRTAHHILIMVKPDATPADQQKALERAQSVLKQVQAKGADFEKLAIQYSQDPSAKTNGGDLGQFTAEDMVPEFSAVAFKTPAGKIVGPVKSQFGYHVIRVDSVIPPKLVPLDNRVSELVRIVLLDAKQKDRIAEKVKALRSSATIKKL